MMLAITIPPPMPESKLVTQSHEHPLSAMTATLSISQSPRLEQIPPKPSRPKLSLNTTLAPPPTTTFTKGSGSSLRLDTLSAVSPTVRNTFSNAYEPAAKGPSTPIPSKLDQVSTPVDLAELEDPTSISVSTPASTTSSTSTSSSSSSDSATIRIPYKLSHSLHSVLKNSPIPPSETRRMSLATSRPMFPAEKRVSFRQPLIEEIKTDKYTMAHSDLYLESTLDCSTDGSKTSSNHTAQSHATSSFSKLSRARSEKPTRTARSPRTGDKRDSDSSDTDSDACPETPVAGRRKKHREWVWTLGPVGPKNPPSGDELRSSESEEH